jgi:hypothetical protein
MEDENPTILDRFKFRLGEYTKLPWCWWPFEPPKKSCAKDVARIPWERVSSVNLEYLCQAASNGANDQSQACGYRRTVEVAANLLQPISKQSQDSIPSEESRKVSGASETINLQPSQTARHGVLGLGKQPVETSRHKTSPEEHPLSSRTTSNSKLISLSSTTTTTLPSIPIQAHVGNQNGTVCASGSTNIPLQNLAGQGTPGTPHSAVQRAGKGAGKSIAMPAGEHVLLGINEGYHLRLVQIDRSNCSDSA